MNFINKITFLGILALSFLANIHATDKKNETFRDLIIKAEFLYLDEEGKKAPLKEKREALKELCSYKTLFRKYLKDEDFIKKHPISVEEKETIEEVFFPLTKEVIRHLENQIESEYKPLVPSHFQRIGKPLAYSAVISAATYVIAILLEKTGKISNDAVKKVGIGSFIGGTTLATAWTLLNYKD